MRDETWNNLRVRLVGGPDRRGGGTGPVVVLLHGFGAPGDDLVGLWSMLAVPPETRFVFPAAPLTLDMGFGDSRAWWMLDMERLSRARAAGEWDRLTREVPEGLADARRQVMGLLEAVQTELSVEAEQIIVGGFSQGAMLACDTVLRCDLRVAGLVFLSGSLIARGDWEPLMAARQGLPVFQSHGIHDPILSADVARELHGLFHASALQAEWHEFHGGHEIPLEILEHLSVFLTRAWPTKAP